MEVAEQTRVREYGLDALRVGAFALLIGYHAAMYYVPWPWMVKSRQTSAWLTWVLTAVNLWRLPLLFFVAGGGTWFSLGRRGYAAFTGERLRRLGLPLLFGMLVIVPPQIYVERVVAGERYGSYLEFWRTVLTLEPYPRGNLSWHHLWFLPYLLTYSLLLLPALAFLRSDAGRSLVDRLAGCCERPGVLYLLNVPVVVAALLLRPHWPRTDNLVSDWAGFTEFLLAFLLGVVICSSTRFLDVLERRWREFLGVAVAMLVPVMVIRAGGFPAWATTGEVTTVVDAYYAFAVILGLVGWSRAHLDRDSPALRRANTAVYPFYIVHQTVTVLIGWALRDRGPSVWLGLPLLGAGTFLGSWAVYECVRRTRVTRVLFGMRA